MLLQVRASDAPAAPDPKGWELAAVAPAPHGCLAHPQVAGDLVYREHFRRWLILIHCITSRLELTWCPTTICNLQSAWHHGRLIGPAVAQPAHAQQVGW